MLQIDGHGRIHLFEVDGRPYLYDVHCGAALRIRDVDRAVLRGLARGRAFAALGQGYGREAVEESLAQVHKLLGQGVIGGPAPDFTDNRCEIQHQVVPRLVAGELRPARSVDVFVSADCNLGCGYCWNKQGNFGNDAAIMDRATGRAVIDFLAAQGDAPLDLLLFGGEPLLAPGFLEDFLSHANRAFGRVGKPVRFLANTNGTLLDDDRIDLIRRYRVGVTVSFDGPRDVQDRNRPERGGGSSFDQVVAGLRRYAAVIGEMPPVRVTMSPHSRPWIETFEFLRWLGVTRISTAWSFGTADTMLDPYFAWSAEEKREHVHRNLVAFADHYLDYLASLPEDASPVIEGYFFDYIQRAFQGLRCHNCGVYAGTNLAFGTDGAIYPCVDAMGRPHLEMGDVFDGIRDTTPLRAAAERMVDDLPQCDGCWLKYLCAGGCFVESHRYEQGRYDFQPDLAECEAQRRSFEVALAFMAELMERSPAMFQRYYGELVGEHRC